MNSFLLVVFAVLGTIILIELNTGNVPFTTEEEVVMMETMTSSSIRNYNAVATNKGKILLWKGENRQNAEMLIRHEDVIENLKFSEDGRWLLSTDKQGKSNLWTTRKGDFVLEMHRLVDNRLSNKDVKLLNVDAFNRQLVFLTRNNVKIYYDYNKNKIVNAPIDVAQVE
jgi:WD40 repeat protein